jgi:hypothetical protein
MPSSATSRGRLEKQGSGENSNTWGHIKLNGVLDLLDEQIDGVEAIALTGNLTLSTTNYASDQQRNKAYRFTGTGSYQVAMPATEWVKLFINATTGTLTVTNGTNSTSIATGKTFWIASNGTNLYKDTTVEDASAAAAASASAALDSATAAAGSATTAAGHASTASTQATNAATSATASATSATASASSATTAAGHVTTAAGHVATAAGHVTTASEWAQKTSGTVDGSGYSAKYWAQQAGASAGALPTQSGNSGKFLSTDGTSASWAAVGALIPTAQSTAYTVTTADKGKLFDATGLTAAISFTLPAASACSADFYFLVRNATYNAATIRYVTLTRNGSDTIDGEAANLNVYAETVRVVRNAAGNGWTVEKNNEVVCWDYTTTAGATAIDFTLPFSDTQFEGYRIDALFIMAANAYPLMQLGIAGTVQTTNYNTAEHYASSGVSSGSNSTFNTAIPLSSDGNATVPAHSETLIQNARGTSGGARGPRVLSRGQGHAGVGVTVGHVAAVGALTSVRILLGGGVTINTGSRFRITGIRKGN